MQSLQQMQNTPGLGGGGAPFGTSLSYAMHHACIMMHTILVMWSLYVHVMCNYRRCSSTRCTISGHMIASVIISCLPIYLLIISSDSHPLLSSHPFIIRHRCTIAQSIVITIMYTTSSPYSLQWSQQLHRDAREKEGAHVLERQQMNIGWNI